GRRPHRRRGGRRAHHRGPRAGPGGNLRRGRLISAMMRHSPGMRLRFLAIAALLVVALTAAPAGAVPSATGKHRSDTWVGQVLRDGRHFDYQGSTCPESAEACIKMLARFRIVPLT